MKEENRTIQANRVSIPLNHRVEGYFNFRLNINFMLTMLQGHSWHQKLYSIFDMVISVCMNAYISESIRARVSKFCDNMIYYQ